MSFCWEWHKSGQLTCSRCSKCVRVRVCMYMCVSWGETATLSPSTSPSALSLLLYCSCPPENPSHKTNRPREGREKEETKGLNQVSSFLPLHMTTPGSVTGRDRLGWAGGSYAGELSCRWSGPLQVVRRMQYLRACESVSGNRGLSFASADSPLMTSSCKIF